MRPRSLPLGLAIALALAGMGGVTARADSRPAADKVNTGKDQDKDNTLPGSVRRVERESGGKVLKAQPIQRDGREIYRIKIVTPQGRVRVVEDDVGPPPRQPPPDNRHRL